MRLFLPGADAFFALSDAGAQLTETVIGTVESADVARVATLILNGIEVTAQVNRRAKPEEAARLAAPDARSLGNGRFCTL